MVVAGEAVSAATRDSIAAIGGVRSGSDERIELYFWTMSNLVERRVPVSIQVMAG